MGVYSKHILPRVVHFTCGLKPNMRQREKVVPLASGEVLEVGFGTALNLRYYGPEVKTVTGLDPMVTDGVRAVDDRIAAVSFPIERTALRADGELPFDEGRFDNEVISVTTTMKVLVNKETGETADKEITISADEGNRPRWTSPVRVRAS